MRPSVLFAVASFLALPGATHAEGVVIDHDAVTCMIAGRFPQLDARFAPSDQVAKARVDFRAEADTHWYYVDMKPEGTAFRGTLPQPLKDTGQVHYYIEVTDKALTESRTEEHVAGVVDSGGICADPKKVAAAVGSASVKVGVPAGAPAVPTGFSASGVVASSASGATGATSGAAASGSGGHATAIVVGIAAAGAATTGIVLATKDDEKTITGTWVLQDPVSMDTLQLTQDGSTISGALVSSSGGAPPGAPLPWPCTGALSGTAMTLDCRNTAGGTYFSVYGRTNACKFGKTGPADTIPVGQSYALTVNTAYTQMTGQECGCGGCGDITLDKRP